MTKKEIYDTWDGWCLRKLKEIGKSTLKQWAKAMGYENPSIMKKMAQQLEKTGKLNVREIPRPITTITTRRLYTYEVKESVVFKSDLLVDAENLVELTDESHSMSTGRNMNHHLDIYHKKKKKKKKSYCEQDLNRRS